MKAVARLVVCTIILTGCSDRQGSELSEKVAARANEPIVTIAGKTLTGAMLDRRVAMMDALKRHKEPKISPKRAGQYREKLAKSYPKAYVANELIAELARREQVELTAERIAEYEKMAFKRLRARGDKTYADLKKAIGEYASELDDQVRGEALHGALMDVLATKYSKEIPDSYVDYTIKSIKDYNAKMALTNALIYAQATNVWNQLKAGADFAEMAIKYSTIPDERESKGEWGTVDVRQLQDEPGIAEWGRKLQVGEISPPFEGDNGLMIMRLDTRDDKMSEFGISRIFFELPQFYEVGTREGIVRDAKRRNAQSTFQQKLTELEKELKPVYHQENKKGKSK